MQIFQRSIFAFCAVFTFQLGAQVSNDSLETLSEIQLSSNRLSVKLSESGMHYSVITQNDIKHLPVQNINELLAYVSGVDIRQRGPMGTQADIGIRGSTFDQVLVMVDGVRMSDPQTGHHQMNLPVPLQMIERIEVIRGTAARRYGLNALGGVVNIITKKTNESPFAIEAFGMQAGNTTVNEGVNGGLRLFGSAQKDGWNFMAAAEGLRGNGYRYNTDFRQLRTYVKVSKESSLGSFSLFGGSNNNTFGASYFYAAPGDLNSRETVNTQFINTKIVGNLSDVDKLTINASGRWNYDHYIYTKNNPSIYQNKHQNQAIQVDAAYLHSFKNSRLSIGIESRSERINSSNLGNHQRDILGAYGEYIKTWFGNFTTTVGAYMLHTDFIGYNIYPGAEFQWGITESSAFWGNWGTGQRLPTYTDWYYRDPGNSSNPNLKSESAQNSELGYRYKKGNFTTQISVFQKAYSNMIDWIRPIDTLPWTPVNIANLTFNGIEGEFKVVDFMPVLSENTEFVFNACLLDDSQFENGGYQSKNALNYMMYQQNTRVRFKLWEGEDSEFQNSVYLTGVWRLVNRTNGNSYHIFDAKLEFTRGKSWNAYANFMNIGNTQYREIASVPLMPRWFGLGIAAKL